MLAQLGHSECFPMGIRLCHVRLSGRWLHSQAEYSVRNGDLCDLFISEYPHFVEQADRSIGNAERLFQIARSVFETIPGSVRFTLRVHGISPRNCPLGFRDIYIDYADMLNLDWIPDMKALWPFRNDIASCWFVPSADSSLGDWTDTPMLDFILSYVDDLEGCPILVRQKLHEVHTMTEHHDMQAVVIPRDAREDDLKRLLTRSPFWFLDQVRTHMYKEGRRVDQLDIDWSAAEILDLRVNVLSMEKMLYFLWHIQQLQTVQFESEEVSMLQLPRNSVTDEVDDETNSGQLAVGFSEICIECRDQAIHLLQQDNDHDHILHDEKNSSSCAQSEGNSDLRTASCSNVTHQGHSGLTDKASMRLSLEQTLILPPRELDMSRQMLEWFDNPDWKNTITRPWPFPLGALPEGVHIHPSTWEALHCQSCHDDCQIRKIELYVDGATSEVHAGWSVVVVSYAEDGSMFQGVMSGQVVTDAESPAWLGARELTNITAEVTALIVAQMYARSLQSVPQVVIRPDLQLSRKLAELEVVLAKLPDMSGLCAFLARIKDARIEYEEVRAHKHHPWNELADCVAKHAARGGQTTCQVPWKRIMPIVRSPQDRDWAWLQMATPCLQQTMPPIFENTVWQVPPCEVPDTIEVPSVAESSCHAAMDLKICSLNTLALDVDDQLGTGNRVLRLDQQMHERKVAIVGLQETRTQRGRRVTDHYQMFSSGGGGLNGKQHFGCEIWLHKKLALLSGQDGTQFCLKDFKVVVAAADERRLVLKLTGPAVLVIAALHAPCKSNHTALHEIEQWWRQTKMILEQVQTSMMVICCDANAPLGSSPNEYHGCVGAEPSNPQGEIFEQFLHEAQLTVPSTFQCHSGPHTTWRHPAGSFHRRDYILVTPSLFRSVRSSSVWHDVDLGFSHIDHYPVQCHIVTALQATSKSDHRPWDRAKFRDPVICEQFQQELAQLPIPRWDVWVDDHNSYFNENVLKIAQKHFARTGPKEKVRPQLTEPTKNLLAFKRQVLGCMRQATGEAFTELKTELKLIEKQLRKMVWNDQKLWYDEWVAQLDLQAQKHNTGEVYRMLQRLGKRKKTNDQGPRPLPLIHDENGVHATNHDEMNAIWMNQFAKQEAGLKIQSDELVDLHLGGPTLDQADFDFRLLPGLQQIATLISRLKNGRAAGPNKILAEILKAGGDVMCMQLLPILSKSILHTREPLEWKSGTLIPLFKGRGSPADASAYRSIYVSDTTGKLHHSWVRQFLEEQWIANQHSIQLGGRKGVGTDIAHHVIQSLLAWTKHCSLATSVLFLDLRAAFYSVHRGALFEGQINDNLLVLAMKYHGVLPEDWAEIRSQIERDHATSGISRHANVVLADMFSATHFRLAGGRDKVLTCRGTRPGDPVGDLLFNMLFSIILRDSREQFLQATRFEWVGQPEVMTAVDDLHITRPRIPWLGICRWCVLCPVHTRSIGIDSCHSNDCIHCPWRCQTERPGCKLWTRKDWSSREDCWQRSESCSNEVVAWHAGEDSHCHWNKHTVHSSSSFLQASWNSDTRPCSPHQRGPKASGRCTQCWGQIA